ncbi:hypothetical protein GA0061098_1005232 [Bradyrhizobium shewense]|uniref:Uncharacterized protein n=1 Tax=Bradyrhizobium shewense TaxID=1761772 RepID=A0A1C3VT92_9BRAD|nr:hypothetical protein GA0061098_1005232 [Bradyrhizobium shewense]
MTDTMPMCGTIAIAIVPLRMKTKARSVQTMLAIVIGAIVGLPIRLMVGRPFWVPAPARLA